MTGTQFGRATDPIRARLAWCTLALAVALARIPAVAAEELPEYRLKALFVYNFALYTEWPEEVGTTLGLCVYGPDPFGSEIDVLRGKGVGSRNISIQRKQLGEPLDSCQIVFITREALHAIPRVLEQLRGSPALLIADSPDATSRGVALNISVSFGKLTFEANLTAARAAGVDLSSKLLRLATRVIQ